MKHCENCKKELEEDSKFCKNCDIKPQIILKVNLKDFSINIKKIITYVGIVFGFILIIFIALEYYQYALFFSKINQFNNLYYPTINSIDEQISSNLHS